MSSFGKFVFGVAVGAAIGGFIGMLFAPRSGEETRQMIREDMEDRCQESMAMIKEKVNEQVVAVKDSAEALKEKARQISDELEETGRRAFNRITEKNA